MFSNLELYRASPNEFSQVKEIVNKGGSSTSYVIHKETQIHCAKHSFDIKFTERKTQQFFKEIEDSIRLQNEIPFTLPTLFIIENTESSPAAVLTPFYKEGSLQDIINNTSSAKIKIKEMSEQQILSILYCISYFLEKLHSAGKIHGRLKASNIIIDHDMHPLVSDSFFAIIDHEEKMKDITLDLLVSQAPEAQADIEYTQKSDVYSFGMIAAQLYFKRINIFKEDAISDIEDSIISGEIPELDIIPEQVRPIISKCLSCDQENRPDAKEIKKALEDILSTEDNKATFEELKKAIHDKEERNNNKLLKEAITGKFDAMFKYAVSIKKKNEDEALLYFRFLTHKEPPHKSGLKYYNIICEKRCIEIEDESDACDCGIIDLIPTDKKQKMHLMDDPYFKQTKVNVNEIVKSVNENYNDEKLEEFDAEILKSKDFILTESARMRLTKIYRYLKEGVPVLLEGPTGTSKTKSAQIVCEMLKKKLIKYNLSSETKTGDLLGRYVGDHDSWSGIKMHEGPFIEAFEGKKDEDGNEKSCVLLLDEINLTSQECLQFIEEALDSNEISTEISGMPLRKIKEGPNFRLIATQNPNKGPFAHKRQELGAKFLSKFQVINFPELEHDELREIAKGLADKDDFKYKKEPQLIEDLVTFHFNWSKRADVAEEVQCFTVREIKATIAALCGDEASNPYDAVMTIYGARYKKEKRQKLSELLLSFNSFKKFKEESDKEKANFKYVFNGIQFSHCFHNNSLEDTLKSIFFSFSMNRQVILAGEEGFGITQVARWIAKCHNSNLSKDDGREFFCICTEETKCSDLIGSQKPTNDEKEPIKWKPGFLTNAIKKGKCAILDSIDEAAATVTERLNPLLDQNSDSKDPVFEIPENPNDPIIPLHKNFRLICTCKYDKINQMSPAFINRFDVIVLENQLEGISQNELEKLITDLMKVTKQTSANSEKNASEDEEDSSDCYDSSSDEYDDEEEEEEEEEDEKEEEEEDKFTPSEELVKLVSAKLDIENLPTFQQLSQFCKATAKFTLFFEEDKSIKPDQIVDFAFKMLQKDTEFRDEEVPENIRKFLLESLRYKDTPSDGQYYYKGIKKLETFVAKLHGASLISLPVCVSGPSGVGKTSAVERYFTERSSGGFQKHSFHAGTKPNHFYATTTIQDKKVSVKNGSLTTAMTKGQGFIADEMNLSPIPCMKSLAPALEPSSGKEVFIPIIGETITVNPNFFFIACQNELGTLGRNAIPSSIASRFRYFDYPELSEEEIKQLCFEKRIGLYSKEEADKLKSDKKFVQDSMNLGRFMIALNNLKQRVIPKWSFRDITKIFQRIYKQENFSQIYENITFYHQVLFYTISIANEEDAAIMLDSICNLIKEKFELSESIKRELHDCYNAKPRVEGNFIIKESIEGKSAVMCNVIDSNFPEPVLNTLFIVSLAHQSEPIIFIGPSGYKTFISKKLLRNAKTITLNQESTNAQLLGKSSPFTKTEAKMFYLDTLSNMLSINEDVRFKLREKLKNNELSFEEFFSFCAHIEEGKKAKVFEKLNNESTIDKGLDMIFDNDWLNRNLPESFRYGFKNLTKKLFAKPNDEDNSIISNFVFEFRPGLFLSSILEGKSLILKNLSNLPTIVFERFNELFSGEHSLTLQEDFDNTFTKEETNRKLEKFNDEFRVFATCPPNSITKLSEAVLSRFTVIYTKSYKEGDKKTVLKNLKNLKAKTDLIEKVIQFSEHMKGDKIFNKEIPFCQMINIVETCSRIISNQPEINQIDVLKAVLYRTVIGLIEKRDKSKGELTKKVLSIFNDIDLRLNDEFTSLIDESPLFITSDNRVTVVKSKITGVQIAESSAKEVDIHVAFTKMFIEMVDVIHLGIASNTPVILEGKPGQGKQTAIKFVADTLGYDVINIMISQSTKAEDLLGRLVITYDESHNIKAEIIKTKLVEAIESESKASKSIIVFHNINHASAAVLEVIQTIFDPHEDHILLTSGSTLPKRKLNLVGIYNTDSGFSNRDNLPTSLIYSSIYYIINNPNKEELKKVIKMSFKNTEFAEEADQFYSDFNTSNTFAKDNNASSILTLNDVIKYIIFRKETLNKFNRDIVSQIIFAYRFINQETIEEVKKAIKVKNMNFTPKFSYDQKNRLLNVNIKTENTTEENDGISIKLYSNMINNEKMQASLSSLTLPQLHCLLFLAFSVKTKRSCILQGATSSGKSHIIRLFADMVGQELIVYQMNKDTGLSILTGQPLLSSTLSDDDVEKINEIFANLSIIPEYEEYINNNLSGESTKWQLTDFHRLISFMEKSKEKVTEENLDFIEKNIKDLKTLIRQENRFVQNESAFIKAIKEGKWVLVDGIESAPPEIAQKISSLCGDDPELHLIETGKNNYFTRREAPNSQRIHENFHLFVTYNPSSQRENITLDSTFINKCISFTLPPIDSTPEYSAQVIHGSLTKMSYPNDIAIQIGARMSMSHQVAKEKSQENSDNYAGGGIFTGRTLKFVTTEFDLHSQECPSLIDNIYQPVCNSFHSFYWNSVFKNKDELQKQMIDAFSKPADKDIITNLEHKSDDPKQRNENILLMLRNVQLYACGKILSSDFSPLFIQEARKLRLSDVAFVSGHIQDTLDIITKHPSPNIMGFEYPQLNNVLNILKEISSNISEVGNDLLDAQLNNKDLLTVEKLVKPLSKLNFLEMISRDNFAYINPIVPQIFLDRELFDILLLVIEMSQTKSIAALSQFLLLLSKDQTLIPKIEKVFPYNLFEDTTFDLLRYLVPMMNDLFQHNVTFHFKIGEESFDFINQKSQFEPTYILSQQSDRDELLFFPGTILKINSPEDSEELEKTSSKRSKSKSKGKGKGKIHSYKIKEDTKYEKLMKKANEVYGLTGYILSTDISNISIKKEKKKYSSGEECPKKKQQAKYSLLLPENCQKDKSIIENVWSILYSLPHDKIETFSCYLHPLEADVLKCFSIMFNQLDNKNISSIFELTSWMKPYEKSSFNDENSFLWRIYNESLKIDKRMSEDDVNTNIEIIKLEIQYLETSPKIVGWSTEGYIQKLSEIALKEYNAILLSIISSNKEKFIRNNLSDLLRKIKEAKPAKPEHVNFQRYFIESIENIIKQDMPTQELLDNCNEQYHNFITMISKISSKDTINWPYLQIPQLQESDYTKEIYLYECILQFSKVSSIIDKIAENENKNLLNDLSNLSAFEEMQSLAKYLINKVCKNSKPGEKSIDNDDINLVRASLNANFIYLLEFYKLFDKVTELDKILNQLEERKSSEFEIQWINDMARRYPQDFQIVLPNFNPNDIFSLFITYEENKTPVYGPLLKHYPDPRLAKSLSKFLEKGINTDPSKYEKYAVSICRTIYINAIENDNSITRDITEFKKFIDEKQRKTTNKIHKYLYEIMNLLFNIIEKLKVTPKFAFTFNDINFLKSKWKDVRYINKYPSLAYWLAVNNDCMIQLQNKFAGQEFIKTKLPFWLFALRIMSSIRSVNFNCQYKTNISSIITDAINNECMTYLNMPNTIKGTGWLSFMLSKVPPEIFDYKCKLLREFIDNLSQDKGDASGNVKNQKETAIREFVKAITYRVFENKVEELLTMKFDSENSQLSFAIDPQTFINHKINSALDEKFDELKESVDFNALKDNINALKTFIDEFFKKLDSYVENEKASITKTFNEDNNRKMKTKRNDIEKEVRNYNAKLQKLISSHLTVNEFNKECNELYSLLSGYYLNTLKPDKTQKPFDAHCFSFTKSSSYSMDIVVENSRNFQSFEIKTGTGTNSKIFISNNTIPKDQLVNIKLSKKHELYPMPTKYFTQSFYPFAMDSPEITKQCEDSIKHSREPYLVFGKDLKYENFRKILIEKVNSIISSFNEAEKLITEHKFNETAKSKVQTIFIECGNIKNQLSIKMSDRTTNDFNDINILFKKLKDKVSQIQIDQTKFQTTIESFGIQKMYQEISTRKAIFESKYNIPFPSKDNPRLSSFLFDNINKIDFLSSPFISLEGNKISCCFESLNCTIGPITPSLYSERITLNFISFIDDPITIKVQPEKEEYKSWFYSETFKSKEIPKIIIVLPNVKSEEEVDIKTKIIISSLDHETLELPCTFHIIVLPQVIHISCREFPLSYKNKEFLLCSEKLVGKSILNFAISNYNNEEKLDYKYQIQSLDENLAAKPEFNIKNDKMQITIPSVENPTRLHFAFNIKFSQSLTTKIIIDSIIIPFDYSFFVYDYDQKQYKSNSITLIYSEDSIKKEMQLHCRISSPLFTAFEGKCLFRAQINTKMPADIDANCISAMDINNQSDFIIKLKIKKVLTKAANGYIIVNINGIEKRVNVYFKQLSNLFNSKGVLDKSLFSKYDFFYGIRGNGDSEWKKIENSNKLDDLSAVCSPFSANFINQAKIVYSSSKCEVLNAKDNLFVCLTKEGEITHRRLNSQDVKFFDRSGYPLFGIVQNQWYPFFTKYESAVEKWKIMNNDDVSNKDQAKKEINVFPTNCYYSDNFAVIATMVNSHKSLLALKVILKDARYDCFSKNLPCANQVCELIDLYQSCGKDFKPIICRNIIFLLHEDFKFRYTQLQANDFVVKSLIPKDVIENKKNNLFTRYHQIEEGAEKSNLYSLRADFDKLKKKISEIKITELPPIEEQKEAFLLGSKILPTKRSDIKKVFKPSNKEESFASSKSIIVSLPDIILPKENDKSLTIMKMDEFYKACLRGTRILPVFVKNILLDKAEGGQEKALKCFAELYQTYLGLQQTDKSIISQSVNDFRVSFISMVGKFQRAGMKSEMVPRSLTQNSETVQDFISYPNKERLYLPPDIWNKEKKTDEYSSYLDSTTVNVSRLRIGEPMANSTNFLMKPQIDETSKASLIIKKKQEEKDSKQVNVSRIITIKKPVVDEEEENEEKAVSSDDDDDEDFKGSAIGVTSEVESKEISSEKLDGLISGFSEEDSIKASIDRMKTKDPKSKITINEVPAPTINQSFFDPPASIQADKLPIQELINQSMSLSQRLIVAVANQHIPFSQLCVNILVDCSCFISNENKMFNMMLICAMTYALDVLGVPYSAAVFSDSNFKCIIKTFEEKHSPFVLQKICDCLLIRRLCSNLPAIIKYGIDNMEHSTRKQRAVFTFTNGLDEQIILTKSWAESLFTKDDLSFLFVFIKSLILDEKSSNYLSDVWSRFESETQAYKAHSLIKVISISAQFSAFDSFVEGFATVMKRNDETKSSSSFSTPLFDVDKPLQKVETFSKLVSDDYKRLFSSKEVYYDTTNVLKNLVSPIDKLDASHYRNKLNRIAPSPPSERKANELTSFIKKFIENRSKINQSTLETIFRPNKASTTVLSSTGSEIDITALIFNIINPVPDPLIYLEEKGGLIRNYGVSVIIDPSHSCLFELSAAHTMLTIRTILSSLAALDLPCFDLIVAGNPHPVVLCSEVGTLQSLNQRSAIWESLFSVLEKPVQKADLASAIHAANDIKRLRSKDYSSFMFVLTDGLFEKGEKERILKAVNNCFLSGTSIFGIGLGAYPKGIEELFPQVIFAPNPSLVMKCVASLFGDPMSGKLEEMPPVSSNDPSNEDVKNAFEHLISNQRSPIYRSLKNELDRIKILQDAYRHYLNKEGDIGNAIKGFTNIDEPMYTKDLFKSQKILIVMLWDFTMNPKKEKQELQTQYIFENIDPSKTECIKTAVEYFGITVEVVRNYKDAIEKLTDQKAKPGKCDYYAVWVICGPPISKLPDGNKYGNLVGQFIDVLVQFWDKGGALVFWAEGCLFYQVNLFLEKMKFKFRIEGDAKTQHKGTQTLYPDEDGTGNLSKPQTFNKKIQGNERTERPSLSHNLGKIFEGVTISYAPYDLRKLSPFIPFARDSEGGVSSLFLPSDGKKGDVIIDCGYTKCFANLDEDGTFRYIQNIAGWTMCTEYHIADGFVPKYWRPNAIEHVIKLDDKWKFPVSQGDEVDMIFCIDATGSMGDWLEAAKQRSKEIASTSQRMFKDKSFRFGAIFYRDPVDCSGDKNDFYQPTSDIDSLVRSISGQEPSGGGDGPEDWVGAYRILLRNISWRPEAIKAVIHIADAPAHGNDWGGRCKHQDQNSLLYPLIRECAEREIFFSGINVGSYAQGSFDRIKQIYEEKGKGKLFKLSQFKDADPNMAGEFLKNVAIDLISTISAF